MTDVADVATANAIKLEVKKDGLQQRQNGDWVLRFTAQNIDMHQVIINAPMGTRFFMTLNELNDDETPVDHVAQERDKWRNLGPVQQAGIRCGDPVFWAFLTESEHVIPDVNNNDTAAQVVRSICGVTSRSELGKPGFQRQRVLWHQLDEQFQAWKMKEAHGG